MAFATNSSLLAQVFVLGFILAISGQVLSGREMPGEAKNPDMKQPQFAFKSDPSFLIPGIGRVMVPPIYRFPKFNNPFNGGSIGGGSGSSIGGGSGGGSSGGGAGSSPGGEGQNYVPGGAGSSPGGGGQNYVPGGDDTFVPNPGFEVPNPFRGGSPAPPAEAHP